MVIFDPVINILKARGYFVQINCPLKVSELWSWVTFFSVSIPVSQVCSKYLCRQSQKSFRWLTILSFSFIENELQKLFTNKLICCLGNTGREMPLKENEE